VRILISFHYYRTSDLDKLVGEFPEPPEIFADSGAFSAMTQGAEIDVHDYAAWLRRWEHLFALYANLDVIGDADATCVNQRVLEDRYGLHPLPVFHVREPWGAYDELLDRYDFVALGVAGHRSSDYLRWAVRCHQLARDRQVRLHGFGITDYRVCAALPWYSVDSSSWGKGHRYGQVQLWDHRAARFRNFRHGDPRVVHRHGQLIREHGGDPKMFADKANYERASIITINALAYMRFEAWLRRRHGLIAAPESVLGDGIRRHASRHGEAGEGLRTYLADGRIQHLRDAAHGVRMYFADSRSQTPGRSYNDLGLAAHGVRLYLSDTNSWSGGVTDAVRVARRLGEVSTGG
jgi:hypothetical protein